MKVIVAGSRNFNNFEVLESSLMKIFKEKQLHRKDVEIVSGTARGADKLGEIFADKYGLKLSRFPADWDNYGKKAGYLRNVDMAKYAKDDGMLIAFWDGQSRGTKHMIDIAKDNLLEVYVISI
ncbi:MAG: DUF2493 domain-containing protein [Bacilli bacterium]|nr:DUF2493 domain-containing protein [Bacilli bacterium]